MSETSNRKVLAIDKGYGGEVIFEDTRHTVAWCGDNGHGIEGFEIARLWNENAARCKEEL